MTQSFIYLLVASVFQIGWLYNMKRLKKGMFKQIKRASFFSINTFKSILPIILYLVFGIINVVFLTWAMETIAPSIAYAIWTGIVIAAAAVIDQIVSKKPIQLAKVLFLMMIVIGILGLRLSTQ